MPLEPLTPQNTTIILVDLAVGFANLLRSHDLADHVNNVVGLAKTATFFQSGLVVTNGLPAKPSGPLYPQLLEVIGGHPVIERPGFFDCFRDEAFAEAVRQTGRSKLVISTEGCILQTVLGALRAGYETHIVVDTCASLTAETHQTSIRRLVQAGAVPVTWFSVAGEFQADHRNPTAPLYQQIMREHVPAMAMGAQLYAATREQLLLQSAVTAS